MIGIIEKINDRKNYIIRKSVNLSHKSQLIASNIDLALLIVTIDNPITSLTFIDRSGTVIIGTSQGTSVLESGCMQPIRSMSGQSTNPNTRTIIHSFNLIGSSFI